jgi:putative addiction module killer protein
MHLRRTETFRKWEAKLKDEIVKGLIAARILRLLNGLAGDARSVGDGVSELRIHHGAGYRVYFQFRGKDVILLLCGGDKGSQERDIKLAKRLAAEWIE